MDIKIIRRKIRLGEYNLSEHAHKERQAEQIFIKEIEQTVLKGDIIEKYPEDSRGASCLVASKTLHVVCGFQGERLLIVTVYKPKLPIWVNWKTRSKELQSRV